MVWHLEPLFARSQSRCKERRGGDRLVGSSCQALDGMDE